VINVFIPTMNRVDRQWTYDRLPDAVKRHTKLVCPPSEAPSHQSRGRNVLWCKAKGITATRDYILRYCAEQDIQKFVMLDDDLTIQVRRADMKIKNATDQQMVGAFNWLEKTLDVRAHCGWMVRTAYWASTEMWLECKRMMYALAYNVPMVMDAKATFGKGLAKDVATMEDFNMTLQLLSAGLPNRLSLEYRLNAGPSNVQGGCSTWRTTPCQTDSARRLAAMYPHAVTVREKKAWTGMEAGMMDVRVQWAKALKKG